MQKFKSVEELVNQLKPEKPVYCIRKNSILSASKFFQNKFPGKILYDKPISVTKFPSISVDIS